MKARSACAAALSCLLAAGCATPSHGGNAAVPEDEIRQVIDRFYAAAQQRNWDAAGALLAPEFEISTDGAEVFGKAAYVELLKKDDLVVDQMALRDLTVRVAGDRRMAWATFRGGFAMSSHGKRHDVQTAETLILGRPRHQWQIVRAHASVREVTP
jgi:ketosteroid isomerase-like protein